MFLIKKLKIWKKITIFIIELVSNQNIAWENHHKIIHTKESL